MEQKAKEEPSSLPQGHISAKRPVFPGLPTLTERSSILSTLLCVGIILLAVVTDSDKHACSLLSQPRLGSRTENQGAAVGAGRCLGGSAERPTGQVPRFPFLHDSIHQPCVRHLLHTLSRAVPPREPGCCWAPLSCAFSVARARRAPSPRVVSSGTESLRLLVLFHHLLSSWLCPPGFPESRAFAWASLCCPLGSAVPGRSGEGQEAEQTGMWSRVLSWPLRAPHAAGCALSQG